MQVQKSDGTRCSAMHAFPACMPHPLQIFHGNSSLFDKSQDRDQGNRLGVQSDRFESRYN